MAQKDISKMNLGELISELNNTRDKIKSIESNIERDSRTDKLLQKREELIKYEKQIYTQLDEKEKEYLAPKPPRVYSD